MASVLATSTPTATRDRLIEAALVEFAAHGFDGASTRAIAERAGVHQPLINYHFASKSALWRTSVGRLFDELAGAVAAALGGDDDRIDGGRPWTESDPAEVTLCTVIDVLVHFAAARPELNRIMVSEATCESERLDWITATYTEGAFRFFTRVWEQQRSAGGVVDLDPMVAYYTIVGASSLLYANAPEARRITGREPTDPSIVDHHAATLCGMLHRNPHACAPSTR